MSNSVTWLLRTLWSAHGQRRRVTLRWATNVGGGPRPGRQPTGLARPVANDDLREAFVATFQHETLDSQAEPPAEPR